MKRTWYFAVLFALAVSAAFAAPFSPSPMRLVAPGTIHYDFSGKELQLPVTLTGNQATAIFMIYTKDMATTVKKITNGFLGWHYMNGVDTCLYLSKSFALSRGSNTVKWDGKGLTGNMVPAGDYTYYLWAYDDVTPRTVVCPKYGAVNGSAGHIQLYDKDRKLMARPVFYPTAGTIPQLSVANGGYDAATQTPGKKIRARWVIGTDPVDSMLVETTSYSGWGDAGKLALTPGDHNYYFIENYIPKAVSPGGLHHVRKFKWVPNGTSEPITTWGNKGTFSYPQSSTGYAGPITDNVDALWIIDGDNSYPDATNPAVMYFLDPADGTLLRTYDFKKINLWWDQTEINKLFKYHGGPTQANFAGGRIYCAGLSFCIKHCIDPYATTDDDMTLWYNGNGDYIGDRFFQPDAGPKAWLCSGDSGAPWVYDYTGDSLGFSMFSTYDLGAVTFGLLGPDGRGIGYYPLPAETAGMHNGQIIVDVGSAYDGIYCDNNPDKTYPRGLWYVTFDSIKGVLTAADVGVKENAPAAFSVSQNAPNPFNPSTTISFTVPNAGKVTAEVYNAAGQKVAVLADGVMTAGAHSVTWNAASAGAGIYFCTVKSGAQAKTVKMTLLK